MIIGEPRNFQFIKNLPSEFLMRVLNKQNETKKGIWYFVEIQEQKLNILSESQLEEGNTFLVKKINNLTLKIIKDASPKNTNKIDIIL